MKGLLKNLGLVLIVIGAVILVACSFTGNVNNNAILGTSAVLVVVGLISYIAINKRIADWYQKKRNKKGDCIATAFFISLPPENRGLSGLSFRSNQFISFSVDVDDFDRIVLFQVLTQFRDIHVHTTGIEIVVINPDGLQREVTLQDFVGMCTCLLYTSDAADE